MSNHAAIFGHESGEQPPAEAIGCQLGEALELCHRRLAAYCVRPLEPIEIDLLFVAGLIAFADRAVTRRRASGWTRRLEVRLPVYEFERWSDPSVAAALVNCLRTLSGDVWFFEFTKRREGPSDELLLDFAQELEPPGVVFPYSDGLDSFAGLRLHTRLEDRVWLMTMEHGSRVGAGSKRTQEGSVLHHALRVPLRFHGLGHPEPTFRTRTFLFLTSAAVACRVTGANRVAIAENGQGALGPALVPVGNEHPYVSSHPRFVRSLRLFLECLLDGWAPNFTQPNLWKVKSSLLRALREREVLSGWHKTNSCSRNIQRDKGGDAPAACGLCGGCLLRRVSAAAAEIDDLTDYFFDDISRSSLSEMVTCNPKRQLTPNDTDHCAHAVLNMANLASAADWSVDHAPWRQAVFDLSKSLTLPRSTVEERLRSLLQQHQEDWRSFLQQLPWSSWIVQSAQEVCRAC